MKVSPLQRHADAEHVWEFIHRDLDFKCEGSYTCVSTVERNAAYLAYTKKPHPSTLGRGGSR